MARNDSVDRTTVRNQPRTENNIADAEAHNERQKSCYRNEDIVPGLSRILCKRSPRVQTAETGMRRQRSDRYRLLSTITPTEPDVKGGEAGLLAAFTLDVWIRRCYSGMRSAK